jgi:hypothetical protein
MSDEPDSATQQIREEEVWIAISAFEKILEAIPNDRTALDALCRSYACIGDHTRAMDYLIHLSGVMLDQADYDAVTGLIASIRPYVATDPRAGELIERIESQTKNAKPSGGTDPAAASVPRALSTSFGMADELTMAWTLLEAKELSQEEYAAVVQDLTEMSTSDRITTVSVLHALEFKGAKSLDRILGFIARDCESPIIALNGFNFPVEAASALPQEFMIRRGVVVFDFLSRDALVAVMNPYDKQLRADVAQHLGRACHFFLSRASEFDQAMSRIGTLLKTKIASG